MDAPRQNLLGQQHSFYHDWYSHPHPVDDWTDLKTGQSFGTRRWRYLHRKYALERVIGCILLLPALPVIALLCVLVRWNSKGDGLYRQVRVGYRGRPYEIIKIRTMRADAEANGKAVWCAENDPRVTWLGKWIRKLHLDELPQLINVAKGEMVLVGPRPERPMIIEDLKKKIPDYERRLSVMPGITGLAQLNLPPDRTIEDVRRKQFMDLLYIEETTFWLDVRMLLATSVRLVGIPGSWATKLFFLSRTHLLVDSYCSIEAVQADHPVGEVEPDDSQLCVSESN